MDLLAAQVEARLAKDINPQVRGWISYYGAFYRSELGFLPKRIDEHLHRWAVHKFKRLRDRPERAWAWLKAVRQRERHALRSLAVLRAHLRTVCGGRMTGDRHVRS